MHPALIKLMRLRGRAFVRRAARSLKTWRGAAIGLFTVVMVACMIGPSLFFAMTLERTSILDSQPALVALFPVGLMLLTAASVLTAVGEKAIHFTPAEVDFLFPAPFSRRQLLVYRIANSGLGSLVGAAAMSVGLLIYLPSWPAAFLGLLVTLQFINLLSILSALVGQTISAHAYSLGRRVILVALGLLILIGLAEAFTALRGFTLREIAEGFRHSRAGAVLTAPFAVYTGLILSPVIDLDFCGRLLLAAGINLLLVWAAVRTDANYLEAAVRISEEAHQKLEALQRGGGVVAAAAVGRRYRRIMPALPRWAGVGPLLQAQLIRGVRTSGRWLVVAGLIGAMAFGIPLLTQADERVPQALPGIIVGATLYITFLGSMMLPMGLRGDIGHIDWLKSLPFHPVAVAAGEVLGPAVFVTLLHCAIFLPASLVVVPSTVLVVAALCALPVNAVFFGVENLVFALYPTRQVVATPGDFQFFGLTMIHMLLKGLLIGLASIPIALVGALVWFVAGPWVAIPVAWIVTALVAAAIILLVAGAIHRFDPSVDTPA